MKKKEGKKPKALVLYSGGLDSMLAMKLLQKQGIEVEAVNFTSPFCTCQKCYVTEKPMEFNIKLHVLSKGPELLKSIQRPKHGYGSHMNPCIDCRILILKLAKKLAKSIGADFLATGEVLEERPMSQNRFSMLKIEKEAGLEGQILRPLSAKLLPETEAERKGLVDRSKLLAIRGRSRKPQIALAEKLRIGDYPCPAGGCLLTDPGFAARLSSFLKTGRKLTLKDVEFLKRGRHFRFQGAWIIVGRNELENKAIEALSGPKDMRMEAKDFPGPITIIRDYKSFKGLKKVIEFSSGLTVRYSDSPKSKKASVSIQYGRNHKLYKAEAVKDEYLKKFMV